MGVGRHQEFHAAQAGGNEVLIGIQNEGLDRAERKRLDLFHTCEGVCFMQIKATEQG